MFTVRKVSDAIIFALAAEANQAKLDSVVQFATQYHVDQSNTSEGGNERVPTVSRLTITAATATGGPTAISLVNEMRTKLDTHRADTYAHDTAVSAATTSVIATNTATAISAANILKSEANAHFTAASVHFNNDAANTITSATATDQTTLNTLANELKSHMNLHMHSAPPGAWIKLVDA